MHPHNGSRLRRGTRQSAGVATLDTRPSHGRAAGLAPTITLVTFTCSDLEALTGLVGDAWLSAADQDWSVRGGVLTWSCAKTADHAIDTLLAPAFFLASRKQDDYPAFEPSTVGPDPSPRTLVEGLFTATRILVAVVLAAKPDTRAVIWRHPQLETRGPEDFVARGALELILHGHDVCAGLEVPFVPPAALCERLRRHTESWPAWRSPGWAPLDMSGDPWTALRRASGRTDTT